MIRGASPLIVRLYSRSREYNYFNHLSLQCLHMPFLLNISSWGVAITFVSSLWAISPWACDLNHFNTYEFNSWHQVTSTNDLILNTIWFLIAWLVPWLNASTLFFTLAMYLGRQAIACPSPPLSPSKPFPCYLHLIKPYSSHIILSIHWKTISSILWSLLEYSSRYESSDQSSFS